MLAREIAARARCRLPDAWEDAGMNDPIQWGRTELSWTPDG